MPFVVVEDASRCPVGRPWAVKQEGTDRTYGCHASKAAATEQQKALYANVPDAKSAAPDPPNLRTAPEGSEERCGTCLMFDPAKKACWGYGNKSVAPIQVCDSYSRDLAELHSEVPMDTEKHVEDPPEVRVRYSASKTMEWRKSRAEALSESQRGRTVPRPATAPLELREGTGDDKTVTLVSYASLFGERYMVGAGEYRYEETVKPGAFKRTLNSQPDVVFRTDHTGPPLARTVSGTLQLREDDRGLRYEATLDRSDPDVQALLPKIRRGDISESSFAFRAIEDEWSDDFSERSLVQCELNRGDVSVVTFGASPATGRHLTLRSEEILAELRGFPIEMVLGAFVEWRDFTLLPLEQRLGKVLSSDSQQVLTRVLQLVSAADDAVDEAQPLLADLMGVPNPDADDGDDSDDSGEDGSSQADGRSEDAQASLRAALALEDAKDDVEWRASR